jgi:5'-phosphate synthase pdxT subunit
VLALQGDVLEHLRVLALVGARPMRVRRVADLEQLDGLVLPGGESTTIGKLLGLTGMLEPLRDRIANGFPVFGTCAGMILLADRLDQDFEQQLLGGLGVEVERNAFGRQVDSFDTTLSVDGVGEVDASFIRAPRVTAILADDVRVLASVGEYPVVVERGNLLASAFHPEITGDHRLHARFVSGVSPR